MNNKILLVIFHPYSLLGGATLSITQILNKIDKKRYEIVYICLRSDKNLILDKSIKKITINTSRTIFSINSIRKVIDIYSKKNFKKRIFVSNQNFANVLCPIILFGNKKFKSILIERNHLDEFKYSNNLAEYIKKNILKILMKFTYHRANLIIGNAKKLSDDLKKYLGVNIKTIYSPSNSKEIAKLSRKFIPKEFLKNKLRKRILSISRFTKRKDLITLLKAFKVISKENQLVDLILIGYGPEKKNMIKFIRERKLNQNVFILGKKTNPYPYFLISNLYVHSSLYEGCPNSIIESLILNLPVISSDCNSGPREILLNGKGGYLYKKSNYKSLLNKMRKYLINQRDLKEKLKFAKKKLHRFEEKNIIKQYENVFQKL